jgi:hypothetical protein
MAKVEYNPFLLLIVIPMYRRLWPFSPGCAFSLEAISTPGPRVRGVAQPATRMISWMPTVGSSAKRVVGHAMGPFGVHGRGEKAPVIGEIPGFWDAQKMGGRREAPHPSQWLNLAPNARREVCMIAFLAGFLVNGQRFFGGPLP